MTTVRCLGAVVAGVSAFAAPAAAQVAPVRHLDLALAGSALYDSNVLRSNPDTANLRGLEREDYRFTPALTIDALLPFGRQALSLVGRAGYDIYARNSRLNRENIALDSAMLLRFGRCDGTLSANYARRQSDLGDLLVIGPANTLRTGTNVEDSKTIGATAICGGPVGLKPTASIQQRWVDNSSEIRRIAEFDSTTLSGGIAYARPSFGLLTLFGAYQTTRYPNRPEGLAGGNDGFTYRSGGARFERDIGARLRGLVELSYTDVKPKRAGVPGTGGLTWRGDVQARVGERLNLDVQVGRSVEASNRIDATYFIQKLYSVDGAFSLSDRVELTARAEQRERDFRGSGIAFGPVLNNDRTRLGSVGARFRQSERLTFTLDATRETREANGTFYDYTSNRVGLGVSVRL